VAQLKGVRIKSVGTFYDINELVSSKDALVGTEIQQPRNASRQTHREIVLAHSAEEYYQKSISIRFSYQIIMRFSKRFLKHPDMKVSFFSLSSLGTHLIKSQAEIFLNRIDFMILIFLKAMITYFTVK
jgi:hypothetical protein